MNVIGSLLDRNESVSALVHGGFRHLIGNDMNLDLWADNWTCMGSLESCSRDLCPCYL